MYILSNAVKNLVRNKGRNILMAVILFIIILTTAVSIIINSATTAIIDDYKSRFGAEVFIFLDSEKLGDSTDVKSISTEEYRLFGESGLLQKKIFTGYNSLVMTNVKGVGEADAGDMDADSSGNGQQSSALVRSNALLMGFSSGDINEEFAKGLRKIVEGRMASSAGEVIISEKLAKLNDLKVGSSISIRNYTPQSKDSPVTDTLTVCGIYQDNIPEEPSYTAMTNRSNELITTLDIFSALKANQEGTPGAGQVYISATYYLKDPNQLEAFQKELYDKGLPKYYKVSADEESYNRIVEPVEGMKNITTIFMAVVLVLGSAILIMLSALSIRERKYEVGVLRAMGMKKGKVALGMLSEMLMITAVCLIIGLGVGTLAAQPVADGLLSSQIAATEQNAQENGDDWSEPDENAGSPLSEVKIRLTGTAAAEISLIALLLAGVSSIAGIVFITRYEPMKILSERD